MNIFIDNNTLLGYLKPDSNIDSLKALKRLVKTKKVTLLVPAQLRDEYLRNVGKRTDDARTACKNLGQFLTFLPLEKQKGKADKDDVEKKFINERINKEVKEIESKWNAFAEEQRKNWCAFIEKEEAYGEKYIEEADKLISEILDLGKALPDDKAIVDAARLRFLKGNPPKKEKDKEESGSYGDAIIWETLLKTSSGEDLVLISKDKDFFEPSKIGLTLNRLLKRDWAKHNKKTVKVFTYLGEFINTLKDEKKIKPESIEKEKSNQSIRSSMEYYLDTLKNNYLSSGATTVYAGALQVPQVYWNVGNIAKKVNFCSFCGAQVNHPLLFQKIGAMPESYQCNICGNSFEI